MMREYLDIDLAWGGIYACTSADEPEISIIRLLDFNRDAYQAAIYKEKFDQIPAEDVVEALSPFIGHAPVDARGLLQYSTMELICRKPLTPECLEGYMFYLEHFEVSEEQREELSNSLVAYSHDAPLKLKLYIAEDELQIEERE